VFKWNLNTRNLTVRTRLISPSWNSCKQYCECWCPIFIVTDDSLGKIVFAAGCLLTLAIARHFGNSCAQLLRIRQNGILFTTGGGRLCDTQDVSSR